MSLYEYRATVVRVVDGDTVHATVDLGCDVRINLTLRLAGINAPEMRTPGGPPAKEHLTELIARKLDSVQGISPLRERAS